jgi:hypothetical protein
VNTKPSLLLDARHRDAGVPVAEPVAHAETELVGIGHLESLLIRFTSPAMPLQKRGNAFGSVAYTGSQAMHEALGVQG